MVEILIRPGVELQQVAGLALIAVQLLSGEHDLLCGFIKSGILQGDFLRFGKSDKFPGVNNAAALCVDLVEILIRPGVELQQVAGLALIAAQLLSGEHDLLRGFIQSRVL